MREDLKSQLMNLQGLEFIYEKQLFPELEYIVKPILTREVAKIQKYLPDGIAPDWPKDSERA